MGEGGEFASRMMENMGWKEGMGLGADGQGMKEAVRVKKRTDRLGLGAVKTSHWEDKWWEKAFEDAVKKNASSSAKDGESESSDSSEEELDADEKLLRACQGRRCRAFGKGKLERVMEQEKKFPSERKEKTEKSDEGIAEKAIQKSSSKAKSTKKGREKKELKADMKSRKLKKKTKTKGLAVAVQA